MEIPLSFGRWLKRRRVELELTQAELAQRIGYSIVTVRKIESDDLRPSQQIAERLADDLVVAPQDRAAFLRFARGKPTADDFSQLAAFPSNQIPIRPPLPARVHLPVPPTPFVGRKQELIDVTQRLLGTSCQVLTLIGPGGIGKTRLAIQVGEQFRPLSSLASPDASGSLVQNPFMHGVTFVSLALVDSSATLVDAVASVLGFAFHRVGDPGQQLIEYLRARRLLLIMDNFEQLLPAALPNGEAKKALTFLTALLGAAQGVKLLVTSREALHLREEWLYPLGGLPYPVTPEALAPVVGQTAAMVEAYSGVALFIQIAQRVQPTFVVEEEWDALVQLCQLVEGMPLGIELAAAQCRFFTCAQIAKELKQSIDFLRVEWQNIEPRHRSLRVLFESAWERLSSEEQNVFCRLALFRSGFRLEAAAAVAEASLPLLITLAEKSLLQAMKYSLGHGRYQLHDLLRQFAIEKLQQNEPTYTTTQARYRAYYLNFLQQQQFDLLGQQQKWVLDTLREEVENIRAVWNSAVAEGEWALVEAALDPLYTFYYLCSRYEEGKTAFVLAAQRLMGMNDRSPKIQDVPIYRLWGRVLARQAAFCILLGHYTQAADLLDQSLVVARRLADDYELIFALNKQILLLLSQNQIQQAEQLLQESLALSRRIDFTSGLCEALDAWGRFNTLLLSPQKLQPYAEESLRISRKSGQPYLLGRALEQSATMALALGDYRQAGAYYLESVKLCRQTDNRRDLSRALSGFAACLWVSQEGEIEQVKDVFAESLWLARDLGDPFELLTRLWLLAHFLNHEGFYVEAAAYARETALIAEALDYPWGLAIAQAMLGEAICGQGDWAIAHSLVRRALDIALKHHLLGSLHLFAASLVKVWVTCAIGQGQTGTTEDAFWASAAIKTRTIELLHLIQQDPTAWEYIKAWAHQLEGALSTDLLPEQVAAAKVSAQSQTLEVFLHQVLVECST